MALEHNSLVNIESNRLQNNLHNYVDLCCKTIGVLYCGAVINITKPLGATEKIERTQ